MGDEAKPQSWWQTLPGILTSATAMITAVAGLIAVLHQFAPNNAKPAPQSAAATSPEAPPSPAAATPSPNSTDQANSTKGKVLTGHFANRCGCWGFIKFGSTHPDLRCQSGLAVARKCVETCPNGDHAWHYECE